MYIVTVTLFSLAFNIPKFAEFTVSTYYVPTYVPIVFSVLCTRIGGMSFHLHDLVDQKPSTSQRKSHGGSRAPTPLSSFVYTVLYLCVCVPFAS